MKKIIITGLCSIAFTQFNFAQLSEIKPKLDESKALGKATKSSEFSTTCFKQIEVTPTDLRWRPVLTNKCKAHRPKTIDELLIEKTKAEKTATKFSVSNNQKTNNSFATSAVSVITPIMGTNYLGNENSGNSPMDNNVAISNGGWIVSVANTTIEFDNASTGTTAFYSDIATFFNDATITNVCDPLVTYDSGADRFIFFAQECSGASGNSYMLICFSKTNNPNDGWWSYKVAGSPLNNNTWFDYPKIAVSNNELYITGNLYGNAPNYTYNQSLLFQFQKNGGYSGGTLNWQYFTNITGNPFTLLPVSYGMQGNYGPGCYLVATKPSGASSIDLYELTDDMSASNEQLLYYSIPTTAYSPSGDAAQFGTSCLLDNGDCRTLSGFYLNGIIHFVFHSDAGSGWNGVNYNRLNLSNATNQSTVLSAVGSKDYSYPAVASFANSISDKSVIIGFGSSGTSVYPEVRAVSCDDNMNWSAPILVKTSAGYSSFTSTSKERWGDYSGACRKQNSVSPSVWINGMYGTVNNDWDTWVAEIHGINTTDVKENEKKTTDIKVYPNPVIETCNLEFELANTEVISIEIIDAQGKLVKLLYNQLAHLGLNHFSFNKAQLSAGTYYISIKNASQNNIKNEKIIISH